MAFERQLAMVNAHKDAAAIAILLFISLLTSAAFFSPYLYEWDSVQFALALDHFNVAAHQPHPPGYPVYVFFGKLFNLAIADRAVALNVMSGLFSAVALIFTYLLAKEMFGRKTGLLSALLLSLAPAYVLFSVVAMSDVVALCLIVAGVYLLYVGLKKDAYFLAGLFVSGLAIGVRPQHFILTLVLLALFLYWKKSARMAAYTVLVFGASVLLWLLPLVALSGGLEAYNNSLHLQLDLVKRYGFEFVQFKSLARRMLDGWTPVSILFSAIVATVLLKEGKRLNPGKILASRPAILLVAWIAIGIPNIMAFENLYTVRYLLPIFAPVSIVFAYCIVDIGSRAKDKRAGVLYYPAIAASILVMAALSFSLVGHTQWSPPAPALAADYISGHYDPGDTLVVAGQSYRHFQYYLPEYVVLQEPVDYTRACRTGKAVIVSDSPISLDEAEPVRVYLKEDILNYKHGKVCVYETGLTGHLFMIEGISMAEPANETTVWRTSGNATTVYNSTIDKEAEICFEAAGLFSPRTMSVFLNGHEVRQQFIAAAASDVGTHSFENVIIPLTLKKGVNTIIICPEEGPAGPENESRQGFVLRNVTVKPMDIDIQDGQK